jgi:hypothetical protein
LWLLGVNRQKKRGREGEKEVAIYPSINIAGERPIYTLEKKVYRGSGTLVGKATWMLGDELDCLKRYRFSAERFAKHIEFLLDTKCSNNVYASLIKKQTSLN